jgi:hypothetical protein
MEQHSGDPTLQQQTKKPRKNAAASFDVTLSFAAGGWFQMFHFGVCQAFVDTGFIKAMEAQGKTVRFCGSSAGSLAAAALASECTAMFPDMKSFALECADHYRESWWNFLCMKEYLVASIQRFGDKIVASRGMEKVLDAVNGGRLEVYATTLPLLRRKCIATFDEFGDVEEALLASCCLTPVVGFPFQLRSTGEWVCDGGITAFQPRSGKGEIDLAKGEVLITVSPFYFTQADIRPSMFVPAWWGLYPPHRELHAALFDVGYNSALDFLIRHQLVAAAAGNDLYKPPADLTLGSVAGQGLTAMVRDVLVTALYLLVGRPLAIFLIYTEMLLMALFVVAASVLTSNKRWRSVYNNIRNLLSLRVFLRLLFSSKKIPINESRLAQSSGFYRALQPLVFEGNKIRRTNQATPSKPKRFIVDTHCNMSNGYYKERGSHLPGSFSSTGGSLLDRAAAHSAIASGPRSTPLKLPHGSED